ncbi:DUF4352 domain-containing protein [Microbacterium cremeum]|uniref:DUF4352 domain-containing protein n=1 Tax=Microbacterium cremeum TaxID=2782169 RepID=UPI001E602300|nr:DUF4352 domain-containing protein [Microbacterium cremeum]
MTAEPETGAIATGATAASPATAGVAPDSQGPPTAPIAPSSRLPGWATWAIGSGLIGLAWFVALMTPGEEQAQAPFPVAAAIGEPAMGRNLSATITDVRRAAEVMDTDGWMAEGNWLVVDLQAASVLSEGGAIKHAILEVDGVRFSASGRPESLLDTTMTAGVAQTGSLAFELPQDLSAGAGRLELALAKDVRLDSMIVLSLDLADVPVVDEAELAETGWVSP